MTDQEFAKAQRFVAEKKREADEASGRRNQLVEQLKAEFNVSTSAEAAALLTKLEKETEQAAATLAAEREAFETKWGHVFS